MNLQLTLHAPQIIMLVMAALSLAANCVLHGTRKTGFYHVGWDIAGTALTFSLLYWGGFFGGCQ